MPVTSSAGYWPWWLGALVLAALVLVYWKVNRRYFGVSGIFAKVLNWREERKNDRLAESYVAEQAAWEEALIAETKKEFGDFKLEPPASGAGEKAAGEDADSRLTRLSWSAGMTFLLSIVAGGIISGLLRGGWQFRALLDPEFIRFRGDGWRPWLVLLAGGLLVGFGTRMAGGCTSGHGLSGCSRLSLPSLVATALFFGTAILVAVWLGGKAL
jgi:uncharacterized protein